jgi:hypothetical protein
VKSTKLERSQNRTRANSKESRPGKYQIPILNDQNSLAILKLGTRPQGGESKRSADNFGHCDLPFDLAQGGELVEPFGICGLLFGIFSLSTTPVLQNSLLSLPTILFPDLWSNPFFSSLCA